MSDRMRRQITLILFAALCVVPTLVMAAWGVSRHGPGHVRAEAQRLGWQLGMKVSITAVTHPRPGIVRYEGLLLANPETGVEVARCRILEVAWGGAGGGWLLKLRAIEPEVSATALDEVQRLVDRVLAGRAGPMDGEIRLLADSLVIRSDRGPQSFCDVEGVVETLPEGPAGTVFFRLPGRSMPKRAWLSLGRDHQQARPQCVLGLDTEDNDLPCSVLALAADGRDASAQGRFCGNIHGSETVDGWDVQVQGQFDRSEIERLFWHMHIPEGTRLAFLPKAVGSRQ